MKPLSRVRNNFYRQNKLKKELLKNLLISTALGDALGVTTEFMSLDDIKYHIIPEIKKDGWPQISKGGGAFRMKAGQHSDDTDMSCFIVESFIEKQGLDANDIARRFVKWYRSHPKDIGNSTYKVLSQIDRGVPWQKASYSVYRNNHLSSPNGSLMRNGVVYGLSNGLFGLFENTIVQSIITHYSPLATMCCCAHSWFIHILFCDDFAGKDFKTELFPEFEKLIFSYLASTTNEDVKEWINNVSLDEIKEAIFTIKESRFVRNAPVDLFFEDYSDNMGYSVLALELAKDIVVKSGSIEKVEVHAYFYSIEHLFFPRKKGFEAISWIPLIGYDADTYGAIIGPLLFAKYKNIPEKMIANLEIHDFIEKWGLK